jgi:DNA (cytosine-5)-methyltransferase 1
MASPKRGDVRRHGQIVDLFAGAGGWDEGLRELGHAALGIDNDHWACATARAAGHERIEADIAALDPESFAPVWGLIGSPPCQAYSITGTKLGKIDQPQVIECARELADGSDTRAFRLRTCKDERSLLTVEPLRFALALRPRWVAMEQVPAVAELWSIFAELLEAHGYRSATGLLSAERYGVPQSRKRAFLIASLDGPVEMPEPTHRSFHPRRHKPREDELHLPRWRSIGQALGWGKAPAMLRTNHTRSGQVPGGSRRSFELPSYTLIGSSYTWKVESKLDDSRRAVPRRAERQPEACRHHDERRLADRGKKTRAPDSSDWTRLTVEQASVLQGFRHDYPWQGSRIERFRQVGNTVCPPLARLVLREAMRPSLERGGEAR